MTTLQTRTSRHDVLRTWRMPLVLCVKTSDLRSLVDGAVRTAW
jgi:hypothetical protein